MMSSGSGWVCVVKSGASDQLDVQGEIKVELSRMDARVRYL